uniref:Secreted protein n=1 Tax=Angiostrongylus cantonensis TaxID=6313 RepID=A0A0K0DQ05_ANGCA
MVKCSIHIAAVVFISLAAVIAKFLPGVHQPSKEIAVKSRPVRKHVLTTAFALHTRMPPTVVIVSWVSNVSL